MIMHYHYFFFVNAQRSDQNHSDILESFDFYLHFYTKITLLQFEDISNYLFSISSAKKV